VATKIGYNLQDKGYNVVLAGIKSSAAADISGYDLIIVGGPIYADTPAKTVQDYLANLSPTGNQKIGVFGYGTISVDNSDYSAVLKQVANLSEDNSLTVNAVVKVASDGDVDAQCQDFINRLTA
jgi:flavodoxin